MDITNWIIERYEQTHRLGNWAAHGLQPSLEGVTVEMAYWRPAPDQHTIAEIVAHVAYHKELVARRLRGGTWAESREPDDWQSGPATEEGWARVLTRLGDAHRDLMAVIVQLRTDNLLQPLHKSWLAPELVTRRIDLAVDIATHDMYHAGQIFVLKRLFRGATAPTDRP
jgi:uncharacterized damage-inducible protein DinB